jgi:hypothetical protein
MSTLPLEQVWSEMSSVRVALRTSYGIARHGLVEVEMLGAEEHAAFDRESVVDNDSLVLRDRKAGGVKCLGGEVVDDQSALETNEHEAGCGCLGEEAGRRAGRV